MADFDSSLPVFTLTGEYVVTKISDGTDVLDIVTIDSGYGATPNAIPLAGKYDSALPAYDDGDAVPFVTDERGRQIVTLGGTMEFTGGTLNVNLTGSTSAINVQGADAHDDTFDANPLGIGAEYEAVGALNTVTAAGDITRVKAGQQGVLWTDLIDQTNGRRVGVADGDATAATQLGFISLGTDGSNYQMLSVDSDGQLETAHDVNTNPIYTEITDQANELDISVAGAAHKNNGVQVMGSDGTNARRLATDANGQLKVVQVSEVSAASIHDYDTTAAVAGGAADNHDYANTTGGSVRIMSVEGCASGKMKVETQVLDGGASTSKAVFFTSSAYPTQQINFPEPVMVPAGGTLRLERTNRETQAQDVYSFINGYA